jgi:pyroglutamyl-peptidase
MRLLLSGFEPFGGERINPSWEVASAIGEAPPAGVDLELLRLPVRGRISFERLLPTFEAGGFDAWLGLGQADGRTHISVERTGVNLLVERDASGVTLPEETIVPGAPAGYFARLPVGELAAAIRSAGAPAQVSETAGTYICNETLFAMLDHLDGAGSEVPAGFIHLPYLPEQTVDKRAGTPSMALASQVLGVRAAIEFVRDLAGSRVAPAARTT